MGVDADEFDSEIRQISGTEKDGKGLGWSELIRFSIEDANGSVWDLIVE